MELIFFPFRSFFRSGGLVSTFFLLYPILGVPHFFSCPWSWILFLSVVSFVLGPCVDIFFSFSCSWGVAFFFVFGVEFFFPLNVHFAFSISPSLTWISRPKSILMILGRFFDRVDPDSKPCHDRMHWPQAPNIYMLYSHNTTIQIYGSVKCSYA